MTTLVTATGGGTLSYYVNATDAINSINPISSLVSPSGAASYYIRSESSAGCFDVEKVVVTALPGACATISVSGPN